MSTAIIVTAPLPPAPLVLVDAGFVAALEHSEELVSQLVIVDVASANQAGAFLQAATKAGAALEKARVELKAPLLAVGRAVDEAAKSPAERIEAVKRTIKAKITAYDDEQRRLAAEAERLRQAEIRHLEAERQAELARLEAKRAEEEAELARQTAELLKSTPSGSPDIVLDLDEMQAPPVEPTATEKAIEAVKYAPLPIAPAVVAPKPAGVTFRTTLKIVSADVARLPEPFVIRTPNLAAIRATYVASWKEGDALPECPGVVFQIDRQPVTR